MKISLFGTFDVDNYGDLLFPLVVERELEGYCIDNYSPTSSITSFKDAKKAKKIESSNNEFNAILIGGGNIIRVGNSSLDVYENEFVNHNAYLNLWLSPILSNYENTVPVIWNCPGVSEELPEYLYDDVKCAIERSDYIAVRDAESKNYIENLIGKCEKISVVPDSVWNISNLIPKGELTELFYNLDGINPSLNYVTFHFNERYILPNEIETITSFVNEISEKYSLTPIIMAIGNCHGDKLIAEKISNNIQVEHILLDEPNSLFEMLSILACSSLYIGSSMHGLITSSSYGNASICVAKGKIKFDGIQSLFGTEKVIYETWSEVQSSFGKIQINSLSNTSKEVAKHAKEKLKIHWNVIRSKIDASEKGNLYSIDKKSQQLMAKYVGHLSASHVVQAKQAKKSEVLNMEVKALNKQLSIAKAARKSESSEHRKKLRKINKSLVDANKVLRRIDVRTVLKISNMLGKVPLLKTVYLKAKKIKHKISESFIPTVIINDNASLEPWKATQNTVEELERYLVEGKNKKKYAVVTAQFGEYEQLTIPISVSTDFDYICYTDTGLNTFGLWQLRTSPFHHNDPVRMARYIKTHLNDLLGDYEAVIWCDTNIRIDSEIYSKFHAFVASKSDMSLILHPHRSNVFEEAEACVALSKDDCKLIVEQAERYKKLHVGYKSNLYETGLHFVNLSNANLNYFYRLWWKEIVVGSRRDQISLTYALEMSNIVVSELFESGLCVRTSKYTEIIPHAALKRMTTPTELSKYIRNDSPIPVKSSSVLVDSKKVDVIICVYNALEDVKICLESVIDYSYHDLEKVIIVDDCSDVQTASYLKEFSKRYDKVVLVRNHENQGYTKSANIGLKASHSDLKVILNSDTVVTPKWIRKLSRLAFSSPNIGIVGPISNAAGSQSVPSIKKSASNQTAINVLPKGYTINDMNETAEELSSQHPSVPLIHGFCIGIKNDVILEIGYFDDINFSRYYGEENDYCLRAYQAGFDLRIASDTYIYHSKSKSIEEEERIIHMSEAGKKLREIYGKQEMRDYCIQLDNNPTLVATRSCFDKRCYS